MIGTKQNQRIHKDLKKQILFRSLFFLSFQRRTSLRNNILAPERRNYLRYIRYLRYLHKVKLRYP